MLAEICGSRSSASIVVLRWKAVSNLAALWVFDSMRFATLPPVWTPLLDSYRDSGCLFLAKVGETRWLRLLGILTCYAWLLITHFESLFTGVIDCSWELLPNAVIVVLRTTPDLVRWIEALVGF